jgi:hypothetical protein
MGKVKRVVFVVIAASIFVPGFFFSRSQGQNPTTSSSKHRDSQALPDLVPTLPNPMNGRLQVKNIGPGPAGRSRLTLDCEKGDTPADVGDCPSLPPEFASTYFDPAFPMNATVKVPALAPGATFTHTLSFWSTFQWPSGKYRFTAVADAAHEVHESRRSNNTATSTLTIP